MLLLFFLVFVGKIYELNVVTIKCYKLCNLLVTNNDKCFYTVKMAENMLPILFVLFRNLNKNIHVPVINITCEMLGWLLINKKTSLFLDEKAEPTAQQRDSSPLKKTRFFLISNRPMKIAQQSNKFDM